MPDQNGLCAKEWADAKTNFEKKTGRLKPSKNFLIFFRKKSGLESALEKMDKTRLILQKEPSAKKRLGHAQSYEKLVSAFKKKRADYKAILVKNATKEEAEGAIVKEITVLSKTLSNIESGAQINVNRWIQSAEEAAAKDAAGGKGLGPEEKSRKIYLNMAKNMSANLKSSIKNGSLFAAKVKAAPTPVEFNNGIQGAARKISQCLANIPKIEKATDLSMGADNKRVDGVTKVLDSWGKGTRKLKADADAKAVLRELRNYVIILESSKLILKQVDAAAKKV